ncbi:PREDICTED: E3 ubiquitin-protein ligase ATL6-like [Nicotiana attenuata]|uniref:RING-type E3 ubiquitin transferase n=1 Tax=Nicotiana attenuata TaxID=49451 RepID=A0A314L734_NICAT|nr:PREDICTED: E3 ubiquitin-protein ligase ATL6-like [Nicotiana attenuata]OIT37373.1 e3 ubiquitin-protein ligase atl6 [Nicotiana attenuata]
MKHMRNNMFDFFLCLLYAVATTGTVSATTSSSALEYSSVKISPALAIVLACVILFVVAFFITLYIRHMNPDEPMGSYFFRHRPVSRGLEPNIIETLPVFVYSDVKALKIGKSILECAVCLNEFEDEDTLRLLPNCCHVFHPECIDAWLAFRTTCPVCRANLKTKPSAKLQETIQQSENVSSVSSPETNDTVIDIHVTAGPQEVMNQQSSQTPVHICSTKSTPRNETPNFARLAPKSTPRRPKIFGMFSRSHSTGHSLIQPGENCERFTLRLPDDVRKRLVDLSSNMPFSPERSSTKGYRFEPVDGRLSKFRFPPPSKEENGEKKPKNLLKSVKSVKSPLSLFCGTDNDDTGERSFTYLRSSTSS